MRVNDLWYGPPYTNELQGCSVVGCKQKIKLRDRRTYGRFQ